MHDSVYLLNRLDSETCDLRCVNQATAGDDFEIEWRVISHHMDKPHERVIGSGRNVRAALIDAFGPNSNERKSL